MSLLVVGLNHRTAPVELLERLTIPPDDLPKALHQLLTYPDVEEGVVVSTCNRIEVYASASRFHAGAQNLRNFLAEFGHVAPEEFIDHIYTYHDDNAIRHLFRVASGIDSMVVGESEVLGQTRAAFLAAAGEGTVGATLDRVFRHALKVGKRVRSETAIGRNAVSVSSAAVELAKRSMHGPGRHPLRGKRVALVGAGDVARSAAQALAEAGARDVVVVSRTEERAEALARAFGGRVLPLDRLEDALAGADIVLTSTAAPDPVIDRHLVEGAMAQRPERPMLLIDIAVPRDVDPGVAQVPHVTLRDIDDLKSVVRQNLDGRMAEFGRIEAIIEEEVAHLSALHEGSFAGPAIAGLVDDAERIRASELAAAAAQLDGLPPEARAAIERVTKRIVGKIVHGPIEELKRAPRASTDAAGLDDGGR